jgi:hypothetical protein
MRRVLPAVLVTVLLAPARAQVDPSDAAVALPIELSDPQAEWARVDVPPAVFAHLRHGTDDLRIIDVDGKELPCLVLTPDASMPSARAHLEPRLVRQDVNAGELILMFDLRVRAAPGMNLELDLRGPVDGPLHVADTDDPREARWEEIPFAPHEETDDRLLGLAAVPAQDGRRYVRVAVPSPRPSEVRLARAAATIRRHRVVFRPADGREPFTLLAGLAELPPSPGPRLSDPIASWSLGEPAHTPAPAWLPADPSLASAPDPEPEQDGRPLPGAELVATLLTLALTIWAVVLRKEG